jgi:hypothetical protein
MTHPFHEARKEHHDRAHGVLHRSGNKVPHRARGGATNHPDAKADAAMIEKGVHEHESALHHGKPKTHLKFASGGHVDGGHAKHHLGKRARGGHAGKGGGKHVTNVIVAPQGGGMHPPMPPGGGQPMNAPPPPRPAPPPPPRPAAPAAMPPGGMPPGAGGPPVGQPMGMRPPGAMRRGGGIKRAEGGSAEDCDEKPERKRGGDVKKTEEVGKPWEQTMEANKGGKVRKRDMGGQTGMPTAQSQMTPQQQQMVQAAMRQRQAQQGAMQPSMGAAQAARMAPGMPQQKSGGTVHVKEHERRARGGHVEMDAGAGGGEGRIEKTHEYGSGRGFKPKKVPLHA